MKTLNDVLAMMTSPVILDQLADLIRMHDADFREAEERCTKAVVLLQEKLTGDLGLRFADYLRACRTEVIADLCYAGYLGYRANLENFHAPCRNRFTFMDSTDYIREHLLGNFPVCCKSTDIQRSFQKELPDKWKKHVSDIKSYYIFLDTAGIKLSHYAGYIISNSFLSWVEPGYRCDYVQTLRYQNELKKNIGFLPL